MLTIGGRYGSHKTALAFKFAHELYLAGVVDRVVSNCSSVWNEDLSTLQIDDPYKTNAVVILDEGGLFLDNRQNVKNILAFLRKMNIILIVPSVQEPSMRLKMLTVQMVYSFGSLGLPLVVYRAFLNSNSVKDVSYFGWLRPDVYGIYDTADAPVDGDVVMNWMDGLKNRIAKGASKYTDTSAAGRAFDPMTLLLAGGGSRYHDDNDDAAERMEAAVQTLSETLSTKKKKGFMPWSW